MCGIAGHLAASGPADREAVARMTAALVHRGPDDHGFFDGGGVALGHRRLSILDLSAAGRQPLASEDGAVVAVVNGELYDHLPARAALEARGHRFRSRSDSELLVHLYEERGVDVVDELAGMFAFALWDARARTLVCARDRLGKKPLHWRATTRGFYFASELRALRMAEPERAAAIDEGALDLYLALQYVPAPRTAFAELHKLPAGHVLVVRPGEAPRVRAYWSPRLSVAVPAGPIDAAAFPPCDGDDEAALARSVRVGLRSAVGARLQSDVPLGAFLSGGLDSSAIVALMAEVGGRAPRTFSVGFEGDPSPELPHARAVAAHVGADHTELFVRAEPEAILPELARRYGEPFADPSALPTYYLSKAARAHVTVALSGDGGDELFGGYRRYLYARIGERLASLPRPLGALASRLGRHLPGAALATARAFAADLDATPGARYLRLHGFADRGLREALASDSARAYVGDGALELFDAALASNEGPDALARLQALDARTYLADCIQPKVDTASMAHALEVRAPLCDHRLWARVLPLGARWKIHRGRGKRLLRAAVADLLPASILRRRKRGFDPPLPRWLRGPLRPFTHDAFARLGRRGLVRADVLDRLLSEHGAGADHSNVLYALLMLELFFGEAVDGFSSDARAVAEAARQLPFVSNPTEAAPSPPR